MTIDWCMDMDWSAGACRRSGWRSDREVHRAVWGVLLAALHRELQRGSLLRPLHQVPCRHVFISLCVLSMPCYPPPPPPHRSIIIDPSSSYHHHASCRRLRVVYGTEVSGRMSIDRRTALNLELICNARRSGNYTDDDDDDAFIYSLSL